MTKEERKEYNKKYRESHKEYFVKKQKEYRHRQRAKFLAMEAELAERRKKDEFINGLFGRATEVQKVEFITDEEA